MDGKGKLTTEEILERGFICRVFYARQGQKLVQTYTAAKAVGVSEDWFSDPVSKVIWMAATELFKETNLKDVTLFNLVQKCKQVASRQKDIILRSVEVVQDDFESFEKVVRPEETVESYAKNLHGAVLTRKTKEMLTNTMELLASGEDPTSVVSRLITSSQGILKDNSVCNKLSIANLCDKALADWDEAHHQITELGNYEWCPGIQLPWRKLAYTLNGFTPDVTILAARPGVGKTSMALNFARFWLDIGKKVSFVSVDMSPIGFVKRQISERSGVSSRKLQFGKSLRYEDERQKIVAEINTLKDLERTGNFNLMSEYDVDVIRSTCSILKDQGALDVLIVDYMQLLKFKGAERLSANQKTTYISNTLHEMANELQIPILCLSQLNRDNTKDGGREPQLSDLRDSGAIEQDAANVLMLYRNDSLKKKWDENEPPVQFAKNREQSPSLKSYCPIWCLVAKCREGDCGTKLPFVVVQNKYMWYLGDYAADGDGKFERVYDDWRHDRMERIWEENGALIKMSDVRAMERININQERRMNGLPEIVWKD